MKVRYATIYKIHGANRLPEGTNEADLVTLRYPAITAKLTTDPEANFLHIDRSSALSSQLLKVVFAPDRGGTLEERLAAGIERMRAWRTEEVGEGVFLIFEGEKDIPTPNFEKRRDTQEFAVCIDAIAKPEIWEHFRPSVQSVLAALGLSLSESADLRIQNLGDVVYLVDPDGEKPIYTFTSSVSEIGSVARPLTEGDITRAAAMAQKLAAENMMSDPARLLIASLDDATDHLQAFVAAWCALEIFVKKTFKKHIQETIWLEMMQYHGPSVC